MGKKQLTWLFLLALLMSVPALIQAKSSKSQQMNSQGTGTWFSQGYNQGYPEGYDQGAADKSKCKKCEDIDVPKVKYPHCGCHDEAAEHEFKGAFRTGFEQGYRDAFNGREQQPPLAADATSAPAPSEMARAEVPTETEKTSPASVWQSGYKAGYEGGQADQSACKKSDYDDAPGYHDHPDIGCDKCMSKERAEHQYKAGFKAGYADGYNGLVSRLAPPPQPQPQAAVAMPEMPRAEISPEPPSPSVEEQPPTAQEAPQPPSTTETAQAPSKPAALPKTASNLPLLGFLGLTGIGLSLLSRAIRKVSDV